MPLNHDLVIYCDMDGVVVDYDAGIRAMGFDIDPSLKHTLNRSNSDNPLKSQMYEAIRGTEFYYNCPAMPDAEKLWKYIDPIDPIMLTASPKFGADENNYFLNPHWLGAAYHKRRWMEEIFLPTVYAEETQDFGGRTYLRRRDRIAILDERFICTTSARKSEFIHRRHGPLQVLIDDRVANCEAWARIGGFAILHVSADDTITALEEYGSGRYRQGVWNSQGH